MTSSLDLSLEQRKKLALATPAGAAWALSKGAWTPAPFLYVASRAVMDAVAGRTPRLMMFFPPRHGKSTLISEYIPAWFLHKFPDKRVILTSYETDFAASWGRKSRNVIDANSELLGIRVSPSSAAANRWDIHGHRGGMTTAGVGGPITGRGADFLIIDDPVKNDSDAYSPSKREAAKDWYASTARTRLEPGGVIVLLMTRWHYDDLAGWLLSEMEAGSGEDWKVLSMPALAEKDETFHVSDRMTFHRKKGEALWPERFSTAYMQRLRDTTVDWVWSALYQQRPSAEEGALFRRDEFRYYRDMPDHFELMQTGGVIRRVRKDDGYRFLTIDLAASLDERADYFACGAFHVTSTNDILVLDMLRERIEGPDQLPTAARMLHKWGAGYMSIEATAYQLTMVQAAQRAGYPVRPVKPDKDKVARAQPLAARIHQGSVYFRQGASWLHDMEEEMIMFPAGAHDDQVDVLSMAATALYTSRTPTARVIAVSS